MILSLITSLKVRGVNLQILHYFIYSLVLVHIPEVSKAFSFGMASFHPYIGK